MDREWNPWYQPLRGQGELLLESGEYELERRQGDARKLYRLTGPAAYALRRGHLTQLSAGQGTYLHRGPGVPDWFGVPPLAAGPEGTRIEFVSAPNGSVCILVEEGTARIRWLDLGDQSELSLKAGEAIYVEPESFELNRLSLSEYLQPAGLGAAQCAAVKPLLSAEGRRNNGTFDKAQLAFMDGLRRSSGAGLVDLAVRAAETSTRSPAWAYAYYRAWVKLMDAGDAESADRVATILKRDYADSAWTDLVTKVHVGPRTWPGTGNGQE